MGMVEDGNVDVILKEKRNIDSRILSKICPHSLHQRRLY